jgi:hypothetical protein
MAGMGGGVGGGAGLAGIAGTAGAAGMAGTSPCMSLTTIATDISAGQGSGSGYTPSAVVDAANSKLLAVTHNGANSFKPSLFRCNLDGTACTHTDISAGQGTNSGGEPSAVVDAANSKLLVVTVNGANSGKSSLFRCNLDGTACMHTDISAGQGTDSGYYPRAVIDAANSKLLVATDNHANSYKPSLFRCNLDGTACTHTDISAGQGAFSGLGPSAVIDVANSKLLVVTKNDANSGKPSLFRCSLDGTACTHTDISAGQDVSSGNSPSAVIDAANSKLLVVARQGLTSHKPSLFRCNLDGTACTHTDISAGQGAYSGHFPSAVIDAADSKLLAVTENDIDPAAPYGSAVPWLFSVCLR